MRICIIVPIHNEEKIAKESLETILSYVRQLPQTTTILVVNDGSRDNTEQIVLGLIGEQTTGDLQLVSHPDNKGYGAALRTGILYAVKNEYDYALFMDSDLTNHPRYLALFYDKMAEGWDYIKATRYSKKGSVVGVPWSRRIVSIVGNLLAKIAYRLPITDFTNGYRAVKVDILKKLKLEENGFAVILEELTAAKHFTRSFCEVPYVLTTRQGGQNATHFSYNLDTYRRYLKYLIKAIVI